MKEDQYDNDAIRRMESNYRIAVRLAVEFGYRAHERGWNLERALLEYDKLTCNEK